MQLYFVVQFVKRHLLTSFKAQEAQIFYDFFAKKYLNMDLKIYTCDCLNNYLTTLELEKLDDYLNKKGKKKKRKKNTHRVSRTLSVWAGRSAFIFFFY